MSLHALARAGTLATSLMSWGVRPWMWTWGGWTLRSHRWVGRSSERVSQPERQGDLTGGGMAHLMLMLALHVTWRGPYARLMKDLYNAL